MRVTVDRDRVRNEFDGNTGRAVQFSLLIELDRHENFRSIVDVYEVDLIDQEFANRLEESKSRLADFHRLAGGWYNGDGEKISPRAIRAAETFLIRRPTFAETYGLFPTEGGGVLVEFQTNGWDISVEFYASGEIEIFGVEIDGRAEFFSPKYQDLGDDFFAEFDRRAEVRRL